VISVVKPQQVVPFVIRTHSPGDRFIGVSAVMQEIPVQVSARMSQVIEREKEDPEFPVYYEPNCDGYSQYYNLRNSPPRVDRIFPFYLCVDFLWIFPKVAQENITPGVFRLSIMTMSIDGNPVVRVSMLIRAVAVAHMVPVMHMLVESLRNAQRNRFHDAEKSIQNPPFEERIMD